MLPRLSYKRLTTIIGTRAGIIGEPIVVATMVAITVTIATTTVAMATPATTTVDIGTDIFRV